MDIVKLTENTLTLSSGLPQDSFSKTDLNTLLKEKSLILHVDGDIIKIEDYFFEGTKAGEDGITVFEGKPFSGELLSDILEKPVLSAGDILSLTHFSRTVDFLIKSPEIFSRDGNYIEDFTLGGGGIIISTDEKTSRTAILFINPKIFEECALNHKDSYTEVQGKYLYKGLDYAQGLCFLRGIVAYKALSGHFPFEEADTSRRQEDIFDSNYIPPELWNASISKNICEAIRSSLSAKVTVQVMAGKRNLTDAKAESKKRRLLESAKKFDSEEFKKVLSETIISARQNDSELAAARASFTKKQKSYLGAKRFLRRNKNRILVAAAVALAVTWFTKGFLDQNAKLLTTAGLTSEQTTQALYSMIHKTDVPNLQEIIKGKKTKDLLSKISALYVGSKQRLQAHPDNGTVTPEQWLFFKKGTKNWMLGVTNLKIDGKDFKLKGDYQQKKDNPAPLSQENGKILKKGDEVTHTAEYYYVNQAEARIFIEKITDTVTLRWDGKKWRVVQIDGNAKNDSVKSSDFIEEYHSLLESSTDEENSRIKEASSIMREKYGWFPSEPDMKDAAEFLLSEYGSTEAEKYLRK